MNTSDKHDCKLQTTIDNKKLTAVFFPLKIKKTVKDNGKPCYGRAIYILARVAAYKLKYQI